MNQPLARVQLFSAHVCDDIRVEENGKLIFIGIYTGSILVSEFPQTLRLRTWLQGAWTEHGTIAIQVRFTVKNENKKPISVTGDMQLSIEPSTERDLLLTLPPLNFEFASPSKLIVQARYGQAKWKTLLNKHITAKIVSSDS